MPGPSKSALEVPGTNEDVLWWSHAAERDLFLLCSVLHALLGLMLLSEGPRTRPVCPDGFGPGLEICRAEEYRSLGLGWMLSGLRCSPLGEVGPHLSQPLRTSPNLSQPFQPLVGRSRGPI